MLTVSTDGILLKQDIEKHLESLGENEALEYIVTDVTLDDVSSNMQDMNDSFVDERISDGYLLGDINYELICHECKPAVKVTVMNLDDWLDEL